MQSAQNNMLQQFAATLQAAQCYTVFETEVLDSGMLLAHIDGGCVYSRNGLEVLCVQGEWAQGEVSYGMDSVEYERDDEALRVTLDDGRELCYEDTDEGWEQMARELLKLWS